MPVRTILVTGGTGGIGLATARGLARGGARVIVTGRDRATGEAAVEALRKESGAEVLLALGELSTRAGVRALGAHVRERTERLDVLLNNAGLMPSERGLTEDGLERGFAVNVIAPLLLAHELRTLLSPGGRIVTLTGGDHPGRVEWDNLQGERAFVGLSLYSHHKLVMMGVMRALSRRLAGRATVNVCYPGQAATRMTQGVQAKDLPGISRLIFPIFRLLVREDGGASAEKASRASRHLSTAVELEGVTDTYWSKKVTRVDWPAAIADEATQERLFSEVVRHAGLEAAAW